MNDSEEIVREIKSGEAGCALMFLVDNRRSSTARKIATLLKTKKGAFDRAIEIIQFSDDFRGSVLEILANKPKSEEVTRLFKEEIRLFRVALLGLLGDNIIEEGGGVEYTSVGAFERSGTMIAEREKLTGLSQKITDIYRSEWFSRENFPSTVDAITSYLSTFLGYYNQEEEGDIADSGARVATSGARVATEVADQEIEAFEPSVEIEDMIALDYITFMLDTYAVYLNNLDISELREQKNDSTWQIVRQIISQLKTIYDCNIRMGPFTLALHFTTTFTDLFKKFDLLSMR